VLGYTMSRMNPRIRQVALAIVVGTSMVAIGGCKGGRSRADASDVDGIRPDADAGDLDVDVRDVLEDAGDAGRGDQGRSAAGIAGGGAVDPPPAGTVREALLARAENQCELLFRCSVPWADLRGLANGFGDEQRCKGVMRQAARGDQPASFRSLLALEGDGVVHVDGEQLAACLALAESCNPYFDADAGPCRNVFEGNAKAGEPCNRTEECEGDAYCDHSRRACPGLCAPRLALGQGCNFSDQCASPEDGIAECATVDDRSVCVAITVGGQSRSGRPCGRLGGADDYRVTQCNRGLWCDTSQTDPLSAQLSGTCREPIELGADCDGGSDVCTLGAVCAGPPGEKTCRSVDLRAVDDDCGEPGDDEVAQCDVFAGATCGDGGQCVAIGDGSTGARCESSDWGDYIGCDNGLYCDRDSHTCRPRAYGDEACEYDGACESGRCENGRCRDTYCDF
jgi:hypothetical protein